MSAGRARWRTPGEPGMCSVVAGPNSCSVTHPLRLRNKSCTLSFSGFVAQPHRLWNKEGRMMQTALRLLDKEMMDKQRALDAALGQIERAFGKGSIMKLGSGEPTTDPGELSSGSLGLDLALA